MSIADLPTLGDRPRQAVPKGKPRLEEVEDARAIDERKLEAWRKEVRHRDKMSCRCCKKKVVVTMTLKANQAQCHHVVSRGHKPTRYDERNGLLVCQSCHQKIEHNEIRIVGTKEFTIGTHSYLDASAPVTFVKVA